MAFFITAGTERLYSGVMKRTASSCFRLVRNVVHAAGVCPSSSKSWLNMASSLIGISFISKLAGVSEINVLASFRQKDSLRKLPMMMPIFVVAIGLASFQNVFVTGCWLVNCLVVLFLVG